MTELQPVKLAIVGCGAITATAHLPAALRSPWIDLRALVDVSLDNARVLTRKYALNCRGCTDVAEILDEVEGVLIATPNHTHLAVAEAALQRGIPTLIEKPLAITYRDAVRMCELAEHTRTFISVGYRSRHWPAVRLLKRLLDERYFGRIYEFDYELGNTGSWNAVSGYSVRRNQAGGGTLIDAHILDKILYWFGEPTAFTYADDGHGGIEANCKGTMEFAGSDGDFTGTFFLSRAIELRNRLTVETERGVCVLEEKPGANLTFYPHDSKGLALQARADELAENNRPNDFQLQLEEFARAVRGRGTLTVDGWFGARSVKLIEAMYQLRQQLEEPWSVHRRRQTLACALPASGT